MTRFLTTGAALLLTTSIAHAGGIDRSGQSITAIFEDGDYAEFSFGMVMPEVSGEVGLFDLGNIAPDYTSLGFAVKTDINDQLSLGLIIDQPYGANVEYTEFPAAGAGATVG